MNQSSGFEWKHLIQGKMGKILAREPIQTTPRFSNVSLFLFGAVFLLIGLGITLASLRIGGLTMKSANAPEWTLTLMGIGFIGGAGLIWGSGWTCYQKSQRARKVAEQNPHLPAMQDHPWDLTGSSSPRWAPFIKALLTAVGLTVFLSIFNWVAFWGIERPLMVKLIVGLFDVILIFMWWQTYLTFVRALKFGASRLNWATFPLQPDTVHLSWEPGQGMQPWNRATFTLRCVQETWRAVKSGEGTQTNASHEELWKQLIETEKNDGRVLQDTVPLTFTIPEMIPGSDLQATSPIFWELDVEVEVPGVDFHSRFLVPIYRLNEAAERVPSEA